jgi:hypothetical protein
VEVTLRFTDVNYGSNLGHKLIVPYFANVMFNYISIIVFCVCSLILQMLCDVMKYIESIKNKTMVYLSLLHLSHTLKSSRLHYVCKWFLQIHLLFKVKTGL